ncbi:hypothetical protein IscW_ISCW000959 [Ixodes scapularis]|uniref:Uncharacterized protein n=1 Tax=Ixodes scapularis TaxID=6945 RepID=B7P7E1_IXOSC|nr:hypothetical protein IscW_ISCW000959 [Ixodes scapularis]|eukprot:XP_002410060.1 hypothetical protein IscW_ISCW000959 [Ixodes scapularis]
MAANHHCYARQIEVQENLCEFLVCRWNGIVDVDPSCVPPEKTPEATLKAPRPTACGSSGPPLPS